VIAWLRCTALCLFGCCDCACDEIAALACPGQPADTSAAPAEQTAAAVASKALQVARDWMEQSLTK
jgi:hypothetical protein